jgi:hypothetical protein
LVQHIDKEMALNLRKYPRELDYRVRGVLYLANTVAYFRRRRVIMGSGTFARLPKVAAAAEENFVRRFDECWRNI